MARKRFSSTPDWDNDKRRQIDNPLQHYDLAELDKIAREFAKSFGADEDLFVRAARVARDPPSWQSVEGLTDQEWEALDVEKTLGFWQQPKALRVTVITLCFSAIVQGWVQSVSNGANQTMPEYLGLKNPSQPFEWLGPNNGRKNIWIFAGINAITYLVAGVFGCWISDPLQSKWLGRRGAIFVAACTCLAAAIGAACCRHWKPLLVCRAILGLGLGAKASVTPVFGAEVSPSHLRGMLVMNWQLFDAFGIFCGFSANLIAYSTGETAWKWQTASAAIPAFALVLLVLTIHESPRWLLKKGKLADAFASLCALRQTPLQAATELFYSNAQVQLEIEYFGGKPHNIKPNDTGRTSSYQHSPNAEAMHIEDVEQIPDILEFRFQTEVAETNYWIRIFQLFRNARIRRSTVAASVVMLGQQLCGANVLSFYSTVFLKDINQSSSSNKDALWLSWGLGIANFIFTFPAYWLIDRWGRRSLLLATYPFMFVWMLGATLSFLGGTDHEQRIRVSVFMFLFFSSYSVGQGPVAFAYSSEVFPLFNREAGMSFAVFINLTGAGILTLFVPQAQVSPTSAVADPNRQSKTQQQQNVAWQHLQAKLLGAFVGFIVLAFILIFCLVPETNAAATAKGRRTLSYMSLEELNHIFKVRTIDFINYQFKHAIPWAVKRVGYCVGLCDRPHLEVMHFWTTSVKQEKEAESSDNEKATNEGVNGSAHTSTDLQQRSDTHRSRRTAGNEDRIGSAISDYGQSLSVDIGERFSVKTG